MERTNADQPTNTGTIVGEDPKDKHVGLFGVALDVELGIYRVLSCHGSASSDVATRVIADAVEDGAQIPSLSLDSSSGFEVEYPFESVVAALKAEDILCIAANGNSGRLGPYLTSSPATGVG